MVEGTIVVDAARYAKLEAMEAKAKLSARRATVKNLILVKKAQAANLTATKAEIDAWITADDAKKVAEASAASSED